MTISLGPIFSEIIYFVVVFLIALIARKIIHVAIEKYFDQIYKSAQSKGRSLNKKRLNTLARAFKSIAAVSIWIVFVFVILGHFNVNMAALLTGAGAVGIFFSIAGRDIIMDLYVGFMALIEDQYRVGDEIIASKEHEGTVEEITLRTVKLRAEDGSMHIVPHSLARSIINKTYDYSTVNVEVTIAYYADSDKLKEVVNEVGKSLAKDADWSRLFVAPISYVKTVSFDKDELVFKAQGKVKPGKQTAAESEFRLRIKDAFDTNGINVDKVVTKKSKSKK
jgi:small conductance mechanosensitive channel